MSTTYTSKTKTGATLIIYRDESDPQNPGLAYRVPGLNESGPIDDLVDLVDVLDVYRPLDLDNLPTFGGETPDDTEQVWSWDETSILVGTCIDDLEIVDR